MIRERLSGELPEVAGEIVFVSAIPEGQIEGYVCVSRIANKTGQECWIHELQCEGQEAVPLMARARRQAQEWGFEEWWGVVTNPRLLRILTDHGWSIESVNLKGRTGKNHGS